jgi:hypothetical protein
MRICVIGNSHAAALKNGLSKCECNNRRDVVFFASRGQTLRRLKLVNGILSPCGNKLAQSLQFTSGGHDEIDPSRYDAFVLCGLGFGLRYELLGQTAYSSSFVRDYSLNRWRGSLCFDLHHLLRHVTAAPIFICPEPYLSESAVKMSKYASASGTSLGNLSGAVRALSEYLQGNTVVVVQPQSTVVNSIFTAARFSEGSLRLAINSEDGRREHGSRDVTHMNDSFGSLMWHAIDGHLSVADGSSAQCLPK